MSLPLEARASRPAPGGLRGLAANRRGVALAEYALLLGMFLGLLTALLTGMGSHLRSIFSKASTELHSGDCGGTGACAVASAPGGSGSPGGSSGGSAGGSSGGSSASSGDGVTGPGRTIGGEEPSPPDQTEADQSGGGAGSGSVGSEPSPMLDTHPH
ncbi:MAG TPA: hypothetical protein VH763_04770 [Gemmatimonadales bacterium]